HDQHVAAMFAQHQCQSHSRYKYHQCPKPGSHCLHPYDPTVVLPAAAEEAGAESSAGGSVSGTEAGSSVCGASAGSFSVACTPSCPWPACLACSSRSASMACKVLMTVGSLTSIEVSAMCRAILSA